MDSLPHIERIYLFGMLSDADRRLIANHCSVIEVPEGTVICTEGEAATTFYVVTRGSFRVAQGNPPIELARLVTGQYFGEMALLTGQPRAATVTAAEASQIIALERPVMLQIFARNPGVAHEMSRQMASRRRDLEFRREEEEKKRKLQEDKREEAERAHSIFARVRKIFGIADDA